MDKNKYKSKDFSKIINYFCYGITTIDFYGTISEYNEEYKTMVTKLRAQEREFIKSIEEEGYSNITKIRLKIDDDGYDDGYDSRAAFLMCTAYKLYTKEELAKRAEREMKRVANEETQAKAKAKRKLKKDQAEYERLKVLFGPDNVMTEADVYGVESDVEYEEI